MILKTSYKMKPPTSARLIKGHPLAKGLDGCWLMNEGGGDKVFDLSGKGNTGTLVGNTHWVPGKYGPCLSFDGDGDYVELGTGVGVFGTADFSVLAWIYDNGCGDIDRVIVGNGTVGNGDWLFYNANGALRFYGNFGLIYINIPNWCSGRYNSWHHVAATRENGILRLYGDDILLGTDDTATDALGISHTTRIGAEETGDLRNWNGCLDIILIYNRPLSASEIAQLYHEPFCMFARRGLPVGFDTGAPPPIVVPMFGSLVTDLWYVKHKQGLYSEI